ncbi:hypothetical protein C8R48DRAFT_680015 [Suillus tomentosus]|nr:hypothetical protein C8R48DRAFT_680015 [Suillus tomentosus]
MSACTFCEQLVSIVVIFAQHEAKSPHLRLKLELDDSSNSWWDIVKFDSEIGFSTLPKQYYGINPFERPWQSKECPSVIIVLLETEIDRTVESSGGTYHESFCNTATKLAVTTTDINDHSIDLAKEKEDSRDRARRGVPEAAWRWFHDCGPYSMGGDGSQVPTCYLSEVLRLPKPPKIRGQDFQHRSVRYPLLVYKVEHLSIACLLLLVTPDLQSPAAYQTTRASESFMEPEYFGRQHGQLHIPLFGPSSKNLPNSGTPTTTTVEWCSSIPANSQNPRSLQIGLEAIITAYILVTRLSGDMDSETGYVRAIQDLKRNRRHNFDRNIETKTVYTWQVGCLRATDGAAHVVDRLASVNFLQQDLWFRRERLFVSEKASALLKSDPASFVTAKLWNILTSQQH